MKRLMRLVCKMLGHVRYPGWYGDGLYGRVVYTGTDGLGHRHYAVEAECDRCEARYVLARINASQIKEPTA